MASFRYILQIGLIPTIDPRIGGQVVKSHNFILPPYRATKLSTISLFTKPDAFLFPSILARRTTIKPMLGTHHQKDDTEENGEILFV